jgi:hypothetical protein
MVYDNQDVSEQSTATAPFTLLPQTLQQIEYRTGE